jgi:hypothetical protein
VTTVCEAYGYQLSNFYQRSFKDGGITFGQLIVLFEHSQKREADQRKFQAAIVGATFKDDASEAPAKKDNFMFGDPEDYKKIPIEERQKLTESMMSKHKQWGQNPINPKRPGKARWA